MKVIAPKLTKITALLPAREEVVKGIILIALSRAHIEGIYPLGLAWAATISPDNAYIALIALCIGLFDIKSAAIKYIMAFFIYYIIIFLRKSENGKEKATAIAVSVIAAGAAELVRGGTGITAALMIIPEAVMTFCAYLFFLQKEKRTESAKFVYLVVAAGILNGLRNVEIPYVGFTPAVFAAFFAVMSISYACDAATAVFSSAVIGFIMYMDTPSAVQMMGSFAISALFSSLLSRMGKTGAAVGLLSGITVGALYTSSLGGMGPADIFLPVGMFIILPEALHCYVSDRICREIYGEDIEESVGKKTAQKLETVANAVNELAYGVNFLAERSCGEGCREMFNAVALRACRGCSLENNCWQKDSQKTYENMYELWKAMENDGYCDYSNMPLGFRQVCLRRDSFLCEFKHIYELYKQNAINRGETIEERGVVAKQYSRIAEVLRILADDARRQEGENGSEPLKYKVVAQCAQEAKKGQSVCGDTLVRFEFGGRFFLILCDGMGSGENALSESRLTADLFSKFIKAGFDKETAVGMINSALVLKENRESFSTVDLLEIDLRTGEAQFLKIGSAQSFIKTRGNIEVVSSKTLPVGILDNIEAVPIHRQIEPGDSIIMVSDGVGEAASGVLKDDWIKKLILLENRDDDELAKLILKGAKMRMRTSDDITSVVVKIKKRSNASLYEEKQEERV